MAASANPSGNQDGGHVGSAVRGGGESGGVVGNPNNGNTTSAAGGVDGLGPGQALKHNPGIAVEWSQEEQSILEEGLAKYASESSLVRYAKIAKQLQEKTVRDVALRCRWMTKKESGKRRKEEHNLRKNKDKKERSSDPTTKSSSHFSARPTIAPYPLPMLPMDNDDDVSYKDIGGPTGQLLEQNAQTFSQISANLAAYQTQDNICLFCQLRDNIFSILNDMNNTPEIMKQMPPLPVKVDEELANSILPRTSLPMQS